MKPAVLVEREAHQRLHAGQVHATLAPEVAVLEAVVAVDQARLRNWNAF
jgi:hypothetical protein